MTTEFKDVSWLIEPLWHRYEVDTPTVYKLCKDGEVVYVGCSEWFRARLCQHRSRKRREPDYDFNKVLIKPFDNRYRALRAEAELIEALQPRHNRRL